MSLKPASPPAHLLKHGAALWREMVAEYGISDPAGLALLATAGECLDRMRAAQKAIKQHGEMLRTRREPSFLILRQHRNMPARK
jgi:hypothetical protein